MSNTMEDSGAILREISSFKDMLDQVNEEIEKTIQRTREIESEILKLSEIEDGHIMRECELSKITTIRGFELEASIQVADISRASAESMERESGSLKINRDIIEKRISDKREKFILQCCEFQDDMTIAKNNEQSLLLSEKEALENEKQTVTKKITALENSTEELIEEILQEIHKSNSALDAEIHNRRSEYMGVIDDINDLRILLGSISSFEDS
ncbi:hypothetical protein OPV22_019662 [Ensete ventricosum]|uniref:t-SNARE coiled-coil homology domain-containing protein n=1 Tax=Ensete ventricosum TaxID=4639 RepID=A0AAV8QEE5_ENSVE|nr:hypothetical protein OPV22_019662 [Ensete ventricosum]